MTGPGTTLASSRDSADRCARCDAPLTDSTTRERKLPDTGSRCLVCPRCDGALSRDAAELRSLEAKVGRASATAGSGL